MSTVLCTPVYGYNSPGRSANTYIHQSSTVTGCKLDNLPRVMIDRDGWRQRQKQKDKQRVSVREREREREIISTVGNLYRHFKVVFSLFVSLLIS